MLEFRILGPLEVVERDQPVVLGGPKQRALLAVLLLHRNQVVSNDRLVDALWGEHPPPSAPTTVRVYVSNLRKTLGGEVLLTRAGGYVVSLGAAQVDADRFEALISEARAALGEGDALRARELLETALGLWRGEPLADLSYEPFAQVDIARLVEARLGAVEDRIEADLMLGRHRHLVAELEALVERYPTRERLLGCLMLALYRCGRQVDALAVYRRGRDKLGDELGLEPGPELRSLELGILNHDPGLKAPHRSEREARLARRSRPGRGRVLMAAGGALLLVAATSAGIVEMTGTKSVLARPNTVAAIDTRSGRVTAVVGVGARPGPIAFGAGSIWVANVDDQTVSRIDPKTLQTVRTISLNQPPTGIAATDTAVWVTTSNPSDTWVAVDRIDPLFDMVDRTVHVGNVVPGSPAAISAHGDTLWVAPFAGNASELDPDTGRLVKQFDPNAGPTGIDFGGDAVWVTGNESDTVTRIDATGLTTPIAVGHGPGAIAVGDGSVWVVDSDDNAVVRIDPTTAAVTATIRVGDSPNGLAVGDGSVWVANSGDGTVTRIDATTGTPAATIDVGGSPQSITVADGYAWVTVDQPAVPLSRPLRGGTLRMDSLYDVDSLDPALAFQPLSWQILDATCAKLLNYPDRPGPAGSQLVPEVAQSLPTRSPDGLTYTFTIRPGFRFSPPSNQPVTAETFKYSIERTLNPRMRNPVATEFDDIVGVPAFIAGRTDHIAGVTAHGDMLTIRLTEPAPDLLVRLTQPFFCAVPTDTPIDPEGLRAIPSAGPYEIASYTPGQGVVLTLNPNYHGSRPHSLARIELRVGVLPQTAVGQVEAGSADYAVDGEIDSADVAYLASRYGLGSPAARAGHQQYFVNATPELDFLALNTHRPLFQDARLRQAVNYAVDRAALAQLGGPGDPLPDQPTDDYLPPGIPGYSNLHVYPLRPNLAKARSLATGHSGATVVFYTCDQPPCAQQGQIVKTDLAAIGLQVQVETMPIDTLYTKIATPGEPFDIAMVNWGADYLDPDDYLNLLLTGGTIIPALDDPTYAQKLAAANRLTGSTRYLTYAALDADLLRNAAPWVAFGNASTHELFSARIGCQTYGPYGLDLAALCVRTRS